MDIDWSKIRITGKLWALWTIRFDSIFHSRTCTNGHLSTTASFFWRTVHTLTLVLNLSTSVPLLPPSSRASRVSLAPKTPFPKTPFPFPFKRLPRRLRSPKVAVVERFLPSLSRATNAFWVTWSERTSGGVSRAFISDTSAKWIDREGLRKRRTRTRQKRFKRNTKNTSLDGKCTQRGALKRSKKEACWVFEWCNLFGFLDPTSPPSNPALFASCVITMWSYILCKGPILDELKNEWMIDHFIYTRLKTSVEHRKLIKNSQKLFYIFVVWEYLSENRLWELLLKRRKEFDVRISSGRLFHRRAPL